jgi:hypothetical protein
MAKGLLTRAPQERFRVVNAVPSRTVLDRDVREISERLAEKRKLSVERNRQAEIDNLTSQYELETAQLQSRIRAIESGEDPSLQEGHRAPGQTPEGQDPAGRIWQVDEEKLILRPARPGEIQLTFTEARDVLREMKRGADHQEQPIVVFNAETNQHIPNPQSDFARKNPTVAWATAREYDKQLNAGKEPNLLDIFTSEKKKWDEVRGALGLPDGETPKTSPVEASINSLIEQMKADREERTTALLKEISEKLSSNGKEDPKITALETTVKTLTDQLQKDREDRLRAEVAGLQEANKSLSARIDQVAREKTADNEIGLMGKIVDKLDRGADGTREMVVKLMTPRVQAHQVEGAEKRMLITGNIAEEAQILKERAHLASDVFGLRPPPQGGS